MIMTRLMFVLLVVWITCTTIAADESLVSQFIPSLPPGRSSDETLTDLTLLRRQGEGSEIDENTREIWEAYWRAHPENAWDATQNYGEYKGNLGEVENPSYLFIPSYD